ncbi:MAG: PEGA domain-containing protein, partial [Thermoplasmata archaeon]|nr:PEGA domain-containing protein [Thermoplasmata archaeon]
TTTLTLILLPFYGSVVGTVSPTFAAVAVGGVVVPVDATGAFNRSVAQGNYTVEATATGYTTLYTPVNVTANDTIYVNLTLSLTAGRTTGLTALDWEIIGIISAALIVVLAVVLIRSQRGRRPPDGTPGPTNPSESPATTRLSTPAPSSPKGGAAPPPPSKVGP